MKKLLKWMMLGGILLLTWGSFLQDIPQIPDSQNYQQKNIYDQLLSDDKNERIDAFKKILALREEAIQHLIKMLEKINDTPDLWKKQEYGEVDGIKHQPIDPRSIIIDLLGRYATEEAIEVLLAPENISRTGEKVGGLGDMLTTFWSTPATRALIKIGLPSLKGILKKLEQDKIFFYSALDAEETRKEILTEEKLNPPKTPQEQKLLCKKWRAYTAKKDLPRYYGYIIDNIFEELFKIEEQPLKAGLEFGTKYLISKYKEAQKARNKVRMKNIETILREWFAWKEKHFRGSGLTKAQEFIKQIEKEKQQSGKGEK